MQDSIHQRGKRGGAGGKDRRKSQNQMERAMDIVRRLTDGSPLFESKDAPPVPKFDGDEVAKGPLLGEGEFSGVHEIIEFRVPELCRCLFHGGEIVSNNVTGHAEDFHERDDEGDSLPVSSTNEGGNKMNGGNQKESHDSHKVEGVTQQIGDVSEALPQIGKAGESKSKEQENPIAHNAVSTIPGLSTPEPGHALGEGSQGGSDVSDLDSISNEMNDDLMQDEVDMNHDRGFMKDHCFREGSARYAVKQLKSSLSMEQFGEAVIDMAMEAKFLAVLSHPNIVKMRGTGGIPCHPKYFLVLDRLYDTLEQKIDHWIEEKKSFSGCFGCIGKQVDALASMWMYRLVAVYDVARAMKYLHDHKVAYRDLKVWDYFSRCLPP